MSDTDAGELDASELSASELDVSELDAARLIATGLLQLSKVVEEIATELADAHINRYVRAFQKASDLARDLARDLNVVIDTDVRAGASLRDRGRANARDLATALAHVNDKRRDVDLVRAQACARRLAHRLVQDLDLARSFDRTRARDRAMSLLRARSIERELTRHLYGASRAAQSRLAELERVAANAAVLKGESIRAVQIAVAAVQLLPAVHRPRYREEYLAELRELANVGWSRRAQLRYASALSARAWSLRRGLAAAHPVQEELP